MLKHQRYDVELENDCNNVIETRRLSREQIEAVFWYAEFVVHHGVPAIRVQGKIEEEEY